MLDGIAGTDLLALMMDPGPTPAPDTAVQDTAVPQPEPGSIAVGRFVAAAMCRSALAHLRRLVRSCAHPVRSARALRHLAAGARALWLQPSRRNSVLTGPVGPDRRWVHTQVSLDDVAAVRQASGATVNDVVLTAVAHGFRALLLARGQDVAERDVMALVPVSMRAADARGKLDNRVAVTHALLPVGIEDPVATLAAVHTHLVEVKASHETATSTVLLHSGDVVPHVVAVAIARGVVRAQQNLETIATNVPGPRTPLYLCGRRMLAAHPFAPIAGRIQIAVAVWSYCGTLHIGVTGDRAGAGDIDQLVMGIDRAFACLASRKVGSP
jgi:diacylglycerol O-acyltransferase